MFTADDFKIMERKCPEERDELLRLLDIRVSLPFAEDDFQSYEKLDMTIEEKIAKKLGSQSVVEGYSKILDANGIGFSSRETNTETLKKILANRRRIQGRSPAYDKIKLTCNRAASEYDLKDKSFLDKLENFVEKVRSAFKDGSIKRLLPIKGEIPLNYGEARMIKTILAPKLNLNDGDEIIISVIQNTPAPVIKSFDLDDETLRVLEQVDKIFDKI